MKVLKWKNSVTPVTWNGPNRCRENIKGNLFAYFFGTKDYKWYINEIDALFHINSTILSHPRNDNICVAKNTAVLSTQRVETR